MLALTKEDITDLYVWLDDNLPKPKPSAGRSSKLKDSELITILIWNILTGKQKLLKDIYKWIRLEYKNEFPNVPCYENFVRHIHRSIPLLIWSLNEIMDNTAPLRIMDSTMLPVCKLARANDHKVARGVAAFGKNHQGWHFGFKLHASINFKGQLSQISFTPASVHDGQEMPNILNEFAQVAVGDGGYVPSVMKRYIWEKYGTLVVTPPHYKQKKKLITFWQHKLLTYRPKIESVFDYLKEHLNLVSSFPRSVMGYLVHYIRILLGYQIMAIS